MSDIGNKIHDLLQKTADGWNNVFIRQNLPKEIKFTLSAHTYTTIKNRLAEIENNKELEDEKIELEKRIAKQYGYWENQGLSAKTLDYTKYEPIFPGSSIIIPNATIAVEDESKFKYKVDGVRGTYAFIGTLKTVKGTTRMVWTCDVFERVEFTTETLYNDLGIQITKTSDSITEAQLPEKFDVTLDYDIYMEQKILDSQITNDMSGVVGVREQGNSSVVSKEMWDAAAYARLKCIEQGDGYIKMGCYGVVPKQDINCVITPAFEYTRNSKNKEAVTI